MIYEKEASNSKFVVVGYNIKKNNLTNIHDQFFEMHKQFSSLERKTP